MLEEIQEELRASEHKGKNKLKIVTHGESIIFSNNNKDKDFKKRILGHD